MKFDVIAPTGGFGNHLRLLLLLSPNFTLYYNDKSKIKKLKYKVKFIKDYVYSDDRTWNNWLIYELKYREFFSKEINFTHYLPDETNSENKKILALTISPLLAYKSYLKFNSFLNKMTKEYFLSNIEQQNQNTIKYFSQKQNFLIKNADILYNENLNFEFYSDICNFYEIENVYDSANEIHNIWYNLHKKSERQFIEYIVKLYN